MSSGGSNVDSNLNHKTFWKFSNIFLLKSVIKIFFLCYILFRFCLTSEFDLNLQQTNLKVNNVCWSEKPLPVLSSPSVLRTSSPLPLKSANHDIRKQINELRIRNSSPNPVLRNVTPPVKPYPRDKSRDRLKPGPPMENFSSINNFSSRHFLNQERHRGGYVAKVGFEIQTDWVLFFFM